MWSLVALALAWIALWTSPGLAADPALPRLDGYVVDATGTLSRAEVRALDDKLDAARRRTGFSVVAYATPSLRGKTVDDVAYEAFNAWGVGAKGADTGVLLVIATGERKIRIETGKGVGGALTDVQSSRVIREVIAPRMSKGDLRAAIDAGTDAILRELVAGSTPEERAAAAKRPPPRAAPTSRVSPLLAVGAGLVVVFLLIVSPTFRQIFFFFLFFGRGGGGGGSGGGRGSGGGGGSSGGGGASGDY